ncbi:hypothetical protein COCVIDRAFT_93173, partial [Bipolaris victoriae FI3]
TPPPWLKKKSSRIMGVVISDWAEKEIKVSELLKTWDVVQSICCVVLCAKQRSESERKKKNKSRSTQGTKNSLALRSLKRIVKKQWSRCCRRGGVDYWDHALRGICGSCHEGLDTYTKGTTCMYVYRRGNNEVVLSPPLPPPPPATSP